MHSSENSDSESINTLRHACSKVSLPARYPARHGIPRGAMCPMAGCHTRRSPKLYRAELAQVEAAVVVEVESAEQFRVRVAAALQRHSECSQYHWARAPVGKCVRVWDDERLAGTRGREGEKGRGEAKMGARWAAAERRSRKTEAGDAKACLAIDQQHLLAHGLVQALQSVHRQAGRTSHGRCRRRRP
jgi:hypothetical protein